MKSINKLKDQLENIIDKYIDLFYQKHDLVLDFWVADNVGTIAQFGDYYFDFNVIRYDLETDQPKDNLIKWYDEMLENEKYINYQTYCKINKK